MQCRICGAPLPAGANACPSCGNVVQTPGNNPQGQVPPTVYGAPPPPPPTNYGSAPTPPPPAYPTDPYQKPAQSGPAYPGDPYLQPGQQYPASGSYNQPMNNPQPGGPSYPGGPATPFQPPRKKSRLGLILAIIAVVVILACIGSVVTANKFIVSNTNNATPVATTTNAQPGTSPSGATIDTMAAQIITNPQTAGGVDKDTLKPVSGTVATTFKVNKPIYVTFNLNPAKYDITTTPAWVNVRFYRGSESILKDDPLQVKTRVTVGYFGAKYYLPTSDGAAEIYWCHTKTCSDGKLAQVVHFTVIA